MIQARLKLLLFSVLMLGLVTAGHAQTATGTTNGLVWSASNGQVTITGYTSALSGSVNIPNSITASGSNLPVSSIGNSAFVNCSGLTSMSLPEGVTSIGSFAFTGCAGLASVTCPNSITYIGDSAFRLCSSLTDMTLPANVTSIGNFAFGSCTSLSNVIIPNSVTSIADSAFLDCTSLSNVTIPDSVTSIGISAFQGCTNLNSVRFAGNAPTMGAGVFDATADGLVVFFFADKTGFTVPIWNGWFCVRLSYSHAAAWLISKGIPYKTALNSTPNHDGVPLLMAYALNLEPTQNQSQNIPKPYVSGSNLCLTYYGSNPDVTYQIQTSADLQNWKTTGVSLSGPDSNGFYTASVPITGSRQFMRLLVRH